MSTCRLSLFYRVQVIQNVPVFTCFLPNLIFLSIARNSMYRKRQSSHEKQQTIQILSMV